LALSVLLACSSKAAAPVVTQATPASPSAAAQLVASLEAKLDSLRSELNQASANASAVPAALPEQTEPQPEAPVPETISSEPVSPDSPPPSVIPSSAPGMGGCPAGPDLDGDGLSEACETQLAEKFAPVFFHSSEETYFPLLPQTYLAQSALWFVDQDCSPDLQAQIKTSPSLQDLLGATHPASCDTKLPTASNSTRSREKLRSFYLADLPKEAWVGSKTTSDWVTYFHAYPNTLKGVTLQYWRFYAYHSGGGDHGGDWVSVHLVLDSHFEPLKLGYALDKKLKYLAWNEIEREGETHARIYSAPQSHQIHTVANEVSADGCKGLGGFFSCRVDPNKPETFVRQESWSKGQVSWFSGETGISGGLVNLGERSKPLNSSEFIQFSGLWGSPGKNYDNSGDWGPAYQDTDLLSNGYLNAWAAGMNHPKREEAYPLSISP